jgi:hypothetical protein
LRKLLALATAGFSALLLIAPTVSASARVRPADYKDFKTCTHQTSPELCMWADADSGDAVQARRTETSDQLEQTDQTANNLACGGSSQSTTTCPFQVGSGLNVKAGSNHEVFFLQSDWSLLCYLGRDSGLVVQGSCADSGNEWVEIGQGSGDAYFINVLASNDAGVLKYACDNGPGGDLDLQDAVDTTCLWYKGA